MRRRLVIGAWFVVGFVAITAFGAYGASIAGSERGSFVMNFPASGQAAGGASPKSLTGGISVPIDGSGFIKKYLQRNVVQIASHSIRNVGTTARSIRFEALGFPETTEWECRDLSWDPATHTVKRQLAPGQAVDLSLTVTFPNPLPDVAKVLDGHIVVLDADTSEILSAIAVTVVRSSVASTTGDCCE